MPGSKINFTGSSSATITNFIEIQDAHRMAKMDSIGLTNVSTTSVPAIEAASVVEDGNSVFRFSTEEPISTTGILSTAAMTYYINLVPSSSQITAEFSSVTPAWRSDYQGYYESTTSINRTVGRVDFDSTGYNNKAMVLHKGGQYLAEGNVLIDDKLAVGTNEVKGTAGKVHIARGTNADTNWLGYSPLIIESNGPAYLNFRTPSSQTSAIAYTDPDASYRGLLGYHHDGDYMYFYTAAAERMRLTSDGYLGIGKTPIYPIDIEKSIADYIGAFYNTNGSGYGLYINCVTTTAEVTLLYCRSGLHADAFHVTADGHTYNAGYLQSGKGRQPTGSIHGTNVTYNTFFDTLYPYMNSTSILITGSINNNEAGNDYHYCISKADKTSTSVITLYFTQINVTAGSIGYNTKAITDGSTTYLNYVSIAW